MLQRTTERFDEPTLAEAAKRFGVRRADLVDLHGFENFVFEAERGEGDVILRIADGARRSAGAIADEIALVEHLAEAGARVSRPLASSRARFVETLVDARGDAWHVALFERAPGVVLADADALRETLWGPDLFRSWGALVGSLHAAAATFTGGHERPTWDGYVRSLVACIPESETVVHRNVASLLAELDGLGRGRDVFGMIHADLTYTNFTYTKDGLTAFDFDNCERCWFAKDIAVAAYYAIEDADDRRRAFHDFLAPFLEGYRAHWSIDDAMLGTLPTFLRLQRLMNYGLRHEYLAAGQDAGDLGAMRDAVTSDAAPF